MTNHLNKRGRLKRTAALQVRLTQRERQVFAKQAKLQGLSVSAWARMILLSRAK